MCWSHRCFALLAAQPDLPSSTSASWSCWKCGWMIVFLWFVCLFASPSHQRGPVQSDRRRTRRTPRTCLACFPAASMLWWRSAVLVRGAPTRRSVCTSASVTVPTIRYDLLVELPVTVRPPGAKEVRARGRWMATSYRHRHARCIQQELRWDPASNDRRDEPNVPPCHGHRRRSRSRTGSLAVAVARCPFLEGQVATWTTEHQTAGDYSGLSTTP